jgi:hypothetical protein
MRLSPFVVALALNLNSNKKIINVHAVEDGASSRHTNSRTGTDDNNSNAPREPLFCRIIHHADVLMIPHDPSGNNDMDDGNMIDFGVTECSPLTTASSSSSSRPDDSHSVAIPILHEIVIAVNDHTDVDDAFQVQKPSLGATHIGQYLQYEAHWVDPMTNQIRIPQNDHDMGQNIQLYHAHDTVIQQKYQEYMVAQQQEQEPEDERSNWNQDHFNLHHGRSLVRNVTALNQGKMIVARVRTADEGVVTTVEEINNFIFGTQNASFTSIHMQCTIGQKNIVPYDVSNPVYELALDGNSSQYTFGSFFTAAEPSLISLLGLNNNTMEGMTEITSLSDVAEYVLLISPKGLRPTTLQPNFRFVAAGAYDSYKVVVTDDWVDTPQVLQHEIG